MAVNVCVCMCVCALFVCEFVSVLVCAWVGVAFARAGMHVCAHVQATPGRLCVCVCMSQSISVHNKETSDVV